MGRRVLIRNQSPLQGHSDLWANNFQKENFMKKKKYLVTYSVMGGGTIEVKAHSRSEAEHLFWGTSDNKISKATDLGGLQIDYMATEDGDQEFEYQFGDYLGDEDEDEAEEEDDQESKL
jgi:hypothetical protein